MEIEIDSRSQSYYAAFRGLRLIRAHVAMVLSGILLSTFVVGTLLIFSTALAAKYLSILALPLFATAVAVVFVLAELSSIVNGNKAGAVLIVLGCWAIVFAQFGIYSINWMTYEVWYLAPKLWLGAAILGILIIQAALVLGVREMGVSFNSSILNRRGFGISKMQNLTRLLEIDRSKSIAASGSLMFSVLFTGWGFYILYGLPVFVVSSFAIASNARITTENSIINIWPVIGHKFWYLTPITILVAFLVARFFLFLGELFTRLFRWLSVRRSTIYMDVDKKFILFLRSFDDDQVSLESTPVPFFMRFIDQGNYATSLDEVLERTLFSIGNVVALGRPDTGSPLFGAKRRFTSNSHWRDEIREMISAASLIIVVIEDSDGVQWEIDQIRNGAFLHKTIFIIPPFVRQNRWTAEFVDHMGSFLKLRQANLDSESEKELLACHCSDDEVIVATSSTETIISYEVAIHSILREMAVKY